MSRSRALASPAIRPDSEDNTCWCLASYCDPPTPFILVFIDLNLVTARKGSVVNLGYFWSHEISESETEETGRII